MALEHDLVALEEDLELWEKAYDLTVIQGKSYRAAAKELQVSPPTAKAWSEKYRTVLRETRTADKEDQRVELESQIIKAIQQADSIFRGSDNKGLTQVGALNSKKSLLELLMKVRGLEAPKEAKVHTEGTLVIEWGTPETVVETPGRVIDVEG